MKFNKNSTNNFRYETTVELDTNPLSVASENATQWERQRERGKKKPLSQPNKTMF